MSTSDHVVELEAITPGLAAGLYFVGRCSSFGDGLGVNSLIQGTKGPILEYRNHNAMGDTHNWILENMELQSRKTTTETLEVGREVVQDVRDELPSMQTVALLDPAHRFEIISLHPFAYQRGLMRLPFAALIIFGPLPPRSTVFEEEKEENKEGRLKVVMARSFPAYEKGV